MDQSQKVIWKYIQQKYVIAKTIWLIRPKQKAEELTLIQCNLNLRNLKIGDHSSKSEKNSLAYFPTMILL